MKKLIVILATMLCVLCSSCGKKNDTTPPTITMTSTKYEIDYGEIFDISNYKENINIVDDTDGKIDVSELKTDDIIDTTKAGTYQMTFYVKDSSGNIGTINIEVSVNAEKRTLESYTDDEQKMYGTVVIGISEIQNSLKSPSSVKWLGIRYNSEKNLALFNLSAENALGGRIETYAIYNGESGWVNISDNQKENYFEADIELTTDEVTTYVNALNDKLEKIQ